MQNKLPLINSAHGSETRNIINELIKLFNNLGYTYDEALQKAHDILNEAQKTNDMNKDVQKQINDLILSVGESDSEVIQARGEFSILKDRLDNNDENMTTTKEELNNTYDSSETFDPIIVSGWERGRHKAFGSIERVMDLDSVGILNRNLVVWRNGTGHMSNGKIEGVYVSDTGYALGESFVIAEPGMYSNIGRDGAKTPNDFRDPNILRLSNGNVLLTFFAIYWEENGERTASESYAMVGDVDLTYRTIQWGKPVLISPEVADGVYGKPIEKDGYVYTASYTVPLDPSPLSYKGKILRADITNLNVWREVGERFFDTPNYKYYEPVLRERPSGGFFIQARFDSENSIIRFDSSDLTRWSSPVKIFEGSNHAKGLELLPDGNYFTGIRMLTNRPGVAILMTEQSAEEPTRLINSGVVYTSRTTSTEAGYMEFTKIKDEEYLGMFHTEGGRTIQCFSFTVSQIRNKEVKNDFAFPFQKPIGAERLNQMIHLGPNGSRSKNLLTNPLFYLPHGFGGIPYWVGLSLQPSLETDAVGKGYVKAVSSGGTVRNKIKLPYSRLYAGNPMIGAARVYCKSPNRVRISAWFGGELNSTYHSGGGWETLLIVGKVSNFQSTPSTGTADDEIEFRIKFDSGSEINVFIDWASFGFGETVPEVANDTSERLMSLARIKLPTKSTTFNLADLGFPSPANSNNYIVNILESNLQLLGPTVTKTATSFTITLADESQWSSSNNTVIEIIGV